MIRAFVAHFEDALQSCRSATRRWKKFVRARVVAPGMGTWSGFSFFFDPETSKEQLDVATSFVVVSCKLGVSKNSGTPKSSILIGFSIYKPSILGYPYFWKHPFLSLLFW